jgi:two-component system C4-dicarboxylate transport sensor histidine kinase DctB
MTLRVALLVFILLASPGLLFLTARWTEENARDEIAARAQSILTLYSANLDGHLNKFATLPRLLAESSQVRDALREAKDPQAILFANTYLARFADATGALEAYIMGSDGMTIAASNWAQADSFVGHDFSFRPYFRAAMNGLQGRYFALGTTSLQRGYYYSYPVIGPWGIEGVAVVKSGLEVIEDAWSDSDEKILITDPDGVIFVSGVESWMFHTLAPLDSRTRDQITISRRYPGMALPTLPILSRDPLAEHRAAITIGDPDQPPSKRDPKTYVMLSLPMPQAGWTVHILADLAPVEAQVVKNMVLVALGVALLAVVLYTLLQRLDWYRTKIILEQQTSRALAAKEEALRHAHDALESRVAERTEELSKANQRLRTEMQERSRAEEQLAKSQDDLIQAGKLAAIGQLAAGITHEVNQPLAALRAYADNARIFLKRDRLPDVDGNLVRIQEMCLRIADISGHLKRFARQTRGEIGTVPLAKVIAMSLELVGAGGRLRSVRIENQALDPSLSVRAEWVRLEQVFVNIIRNAIDAMQDASDQRLIITVERVMLGDDAAVAVSLRDNGPGLPEGSIDRLFQPFFSTKGPDQGLGLGLSISHGILDSFGGALTAENHLQGGAVFTLWLKLGPSLSSDVDLPSGPPSSVLS